MDPGPRERWLKRRSTRRSERLCRRLATLVASDGPGLRDLSDAGLAALTGRYRERIAAGGDRYDLLIEALAAAREAADRALELRAHDEQVMAAAAMSMGMIADLPDGEGKTLACALAAYHASLTGEAVHVIAAGDRRAEEAATWMRPVYEMLGVEAALLDPAMERDTRRAVYAADVVYGSAEQFGFDLLRDDLTWFPDERVQRGLDVAIVDDAVAQLIGASVLPLTIEGAAREGGTASRDRWTQVVDRLSRADGDYAADPGRGTVRLLEPGIVKICDLLGVDELRPVEDAEMLMLLADALEAREFQLDAPQSERPLVLARITVGGLLVEYGTMSGTSADAGIQFEALDRAYGLEVVPIPARHPVDTPEQPARDPDAFEEVLRFQQALDVQRKEMLEWRARFVKAKDPSAVVEGVIRDFVEGAFGVLPEPYDRFDVEVALDAVRGHCPVTVTVPELMRADDRAAITNAVLADARKAYLARAREFDTEQLRHIARRVLLTAADGAWRAHLAREDALPAALRLLDARGDDPVDAYEDALAESYVLMMEEFTVEVVGYMCYLNLEWERL